MFPPKYTIAYSHLQHAEQLDDSDDHSEPYNIQSPLFFAYLDYDFFPLNENPENKDFVWCALLVAAIKGEI